MAKTHRTHEAATAEMFRHDPELAAEYLNSVLADGDESDLMLALRSLSSAFGGVQEVARQAEINAHILYRTLSEQGNPELKRLSSILRAMGIPITARRVVTFHPSPKLKDLVEKSNLGTQHV